MIYNLTKRNIKTSKYVVIQMNKMISIVKKNMKAIFLLLKHKKHKVLNNKMIIYEYCTSEGDSGGSVSKVIKCKYKYLKITRLFFNS